MKKILILGAGNAQLDAIEYGKEKGYHIIGCGSYVVDSIEVIMDSYVQVDISDADKVTEIAEEYGVDMIYSIGSDVAMPSVATASKRLGLPCFIDEETAQACRSKVKMRRTLGKNFDGNLEYSEYSTIEDALTHDRFPAMMKPVDSQGQRGCFRVDSVDDIKKEFRSSQEHSSSGSVIIEDYVEGDEVSVNAYFVNGEMKVAFISDRVSHNEYPGGIIREHIMPSSQDRKVLEEVRETTVEAAKRVGIDNGLAYLQVKISEDHDPKVIEIAPRLDGCHLWKLIRLCHGVDLIDISFEHLLGHTPGFEAMTDHSDNRYRLSFICQPPGTVFDVDALDSEPVEERIHYYRDGDIVKHLNGHMEKCGYTIFEDRCC